MVKNRLNSLRNSTSNLSLRPTISEAETKDAARQLMKDLDARIARMQVEHDARAGSGSTEESARSFASVSFPSAFVEVAQVYPPTPTQLPLAFGSCPAEASAYFPSLGHDSGVRSTPSSAHQLYNLSSFERDGLMPVHTSPQSEKLLPIDRDSKRQSYKPMAEVEEEEEEEEEEVVVVDLRINYKRADCTPYKSELLDLPTPSPPLSPTYVPAPFRTVRPWEDDSARKQTPEKSLFEKYNESLQEQYNKPKESLITRKLLGESNALKSPEAYTQPFCDFLTDNPTVWHAVTYFEKKLEKAGFKKVCCLVLVFRHY
jgi:hypothetical protein